MGYLLGIDAGTTSMKAVLFDEHGKTIVAGTEEYRLETPFSDWVETEADIYWRALKQALVPVLAKIEGRTDRIKGLAISSQGETLIPVDREGQPLRKAIVWLDNRSVEEAKVIEEKFGRDQIFKVTGSPVLFHGDGLVKVKAGDSTVPVLK